MATIRFTACRLPLRPTSNEPNAEEVAFLQLDPATESVASVQVGKTGGGDPVLYVVVQETLPAAEVPAPKPRKGGPKAAPKETAA